MSTPTLAPRVDVRRADERFSTQIGWLDSKHSFSFGHHHDARNTHHGLLLVNNDDVVEPGAGFETHPHHDMEIVTGAEHRHPVHFVQMWVLPEENGIVPGYEQLEIDDAALSGGLVPVASGMPEHRDVAAIKIRNRYAALHAARLEPGRTVELPDAPFMHLFVPRGVVALEDAGELNSGDAVRFTGTGGQRVTATDAAEILVWEMHATVDA